MLPDFLCIGAFKAGTSWLYHNIRYHPDVQMPPYKEIFYFRLPSPSTLPQITHILAQDPYERRRMRLIITHYLPRTIKHIRWFLRYLLLPPSDRWYASLFPRNKGEIAGDITPFYARLKRERVAKIHALLPDAKIIYMLRNPIKRTWSQVAMHFANWYQGVGRADDGQVEDFLERGGGFRDSDYLRTLRIWESYYPAQQFHVAFLDEAIQTPQTLLKNIYQFLGLDTSDEFVPKTAHKKVNVRRYPPMPDHFARYLASQYYEQIEELHRRFDNSYTAGWLEFAEQYL